MLLQRERERVRAYVAYCVSSSCFRVNGVPLNFLKTLSVKIESY